MVPTDAEGAAVFVLPVPSANCRKGFVRGGAFPTARRPGAKSSNAVPTAAEGVAVFVLPVPSARCHRGFVRGPAFPTVPASSVAPTGVGDLAASAAPTLPVSAGSAWVRGERVASR